ncbi:putative signal peptide-containing protein [Cryptosporidium canis]|uniref:Signal peptide-containing protein n=1 Tax=Cryptosporidium canis TaxID=195482 RepID=A0ABQ8P370_9CRYT|nr:putative signal peptide-containing protein [Cryptosporidium canis]KAJ1606513.1 putative signal peptide-containing protein [Cryptosporidium canis]
MARIHYFKILALCSALLSGAHSSPDYSGVFDPTSLLSKEHLNDASGDSWEGPTDIADANVSTIFGDLLKNKTFSEVHSLFPLSPYNSVSDEVLVRCISSEGIVYSPDICPNLDCERYPASTDYKYYNSSTSSTIRVALSNESVVLGSAVFTFDTLMIPSISLLNKFVIVLKTEDPKVHSKISIRLVSIARREVNGETIPILRGSSFHSVEQSIIPGKTFYSVDIIGLFSYLPNEFELSRVAVVVLPSSPSAQVVLSTETYAIARFYLAVDTIPIYENGGLGEKAIQQNKYIQVRAASLFGRSIIDPNDQSKARFNDYCPKTIGGQCLVQITSLESTSAVGIFGFQLYLAGVGDEYTGVYSEAELLSHQAKLRGVQEEL